MFNVARILIVVAMALALSGCVYALQKSNTPGQEKLHIVTTRSGAYVIRIENHGETAVPADGRVVVNVPALPRGCSVYLFGFIKIRDGDSERLRAIHVLREGKVVRKLSLQAIHELPLDSDGYRLVKP